VATEKVDAMPAQIQGQLRDAVPMERFAEPGEVAGLVAYLASEEAGYVTGQAVGIDGDNALNTFSLTRRQR
jgi:3-oxoacyl-[acyl-carrier protein] reductase